jgi:hypothetical protein
MAKPASRRDPSRHSNRDAGFAVSAQNAAGTREWPNPRLLISPQKKDAGKTSGHEKFRAHDDRQVSDAPTPRRKIGI